MKERNLNKGGRVRHRLVIESIIIFFIVLAPFLFKVHNYLPKDPDATLDILGFSIDRNGYRSVRAYIWFLMGKFIPLYLLTIWFFTCKEWWYHIILIPILMYTFQILEGIFFESFSVDSKNIWWLLPICGVVIPFVYLIRIKLYDKFVHGIDLKALEAELEAYRKTGVELPKESPTHGNTSPTHLSELTPDEKLNRIFSTKYLGEVLKNVGHSLKKLIY